MSPVTVSDRLEVPTRVVHDRSSRCTEVVVDTLPVTASELSVGVDSSRLRIAFEHPKGSYERLVTPPPGYVFTDDRQARCVNGVLSVTVGTVRQNAVAGVGRLRVSRR